MLAQDGSLLATCLNAATLALVDAGVPMTGYVVGCTVGVVNGGGAGSGNDEAAEPVLDVNALEEQELPFLTVATGGGVSNGIRMEDDDTNVGGGSGAAAVNGNDRLDVGGSGGSNGRRNYKNAANAKILLLMLETRVPAEKLEDMLSVGIKGCDRVRRILDRVVRSS